MAFITLLGGLKICGETHVNGWNHNSVISDGNYHTDVIPDDEEERAQFLGSHFSRVEIPALSTMSLINIAIKPLNDNGFSSPIVGELRPRNANLSYLYWDANSNYGLSETMIVSNVDTNNRPDITTFMAWVKIIDDDEDGRVVGFELCIYFMYSNGSSYNLNSSNYNNILNVKLLEDVYNSTATPSTSDPNFGDESEPDGYGQGDVPPAFDHTSDEIGIPDKPTVSITTAGFYHAYKVTQGVLNDFGAKLFPSMSAIVQDVTGISSTEDVLKLLTQFFFRPDMFYSRTVVDQNFSLVDMLVNGKAIEYVVDCHAIPITPRIGSSENIKCGARTLDITAPVIIDDYIDFDCGTISIPENFANYIDFHGTRAKLFLTGVGFVDIKPEFWNGGTLGVKYRFNILDGSFMAYVYSTSGKSQLSNTVIGQYGGCMCLHIPVTGINYASMVAGLVTGSMSLAGNLATGNAVGAVSSALSVANAKPSLAQSNNYNSSTAFLGVRRPYLQIERQVPSFSARYNIENGLPLNVSKQLATVSGFTVIEDPQLNLSCDDEEREEIYTLLQKGVIF